MSEKEKKIIESVAAAIPNMTDMQKGYFLGYAEAIEEMSPGREEEQKGEKEEQKGEKEE